MIDLLLALLIFGAFFAWVKYGRKNPAPPTALSEQDLLAQGYTLKEARREARAQRNEQRNSTSTAMRTWWTADRVFRTASRIAKKL